MFHKIIVYKSFKNHKYTSSPESTGAFFHRNPFEDINNALVLFSNEFYSRILSLKKQTHSVKRGHYYRCYYMVCPRWQGYPTEAHPNQSQSCHLMMSPFWINLFWSCWNTFNLKLKQNFKIQFGIHIIWKKACSTCSRWSTVSCSIILVLGCSFSSKTILLSCISVI